MLVRFCSPKLLPPPGSELGMSTSPTSPREPYLYRKLVGARFRLYRSYSLQVNTRWNSSLESSRRGGRFEYWHVRTAQ